MTEALRPELPRPIPEPILALPVHRGYPVPWFVAWELDGEEVAPRQPGATPEFRVLHSKAFEDACVLSVCWVCGKALTAYHRRTFVVGPMCAVNRTSAEPPCHHECAEWSARACPFLVRPHMDRREVTGGLAATGVEPDGIMLRRNPGVALCWTAVRGTDRLRRDPDGRLMRLLDIGDPAEVSWWAEGRPATRAEVEESISTGLPALREMAEAQDERAVRYLDRKLDQAMELIPA